MPRSPNVEERAWNAVFELEADLKNVRMWGELLHIVAASNCHVPPNVLHLISDGILNIGTKIDAQLSDVFERPAKAD